MRDIFILIILTALVFLCFGVREVEAGAGIAVSPGTIRVEEPLFPGAYYNLPSLQVTNNGDEPSDYGVVLAKVAGLKELSPPAEFIDFKPNSFYLEPGASQVVSLGLSLPTDAKPGDYLAYVESHPVAPEGKGIRIGIAVATKLYFTVKPANMWVATWTVITTFLATRAPVSYIILYTILGLIILGIITFLVRKYLNLEFKVGRR